MATTTVTDDYWGMMETYFDAHNRIPERVAMFPRLMAGDPNRLRSAWRQQAEHERAYRGPLCLVHGDAHLGNSYRRPNGERVWFDWQIVRKGRPMRDVPYFLIGSITIEDRRKAERDLLKLYLDVLNTYGTGIKFDALWDEYRRMVVWGLVAWQISYASNNKCNITHILSSDNLVMTERADDAIIHGKPCPHQMVAVYELDENGLIKAWREYLDTADLAKKVGISPEVMTR